LRHAKTHTQRLPGKTADEEEKDEEEEEEEEEEKLFVIYVRRCFPSDGSR
jgi:ribosomal protein L12E/L44/L45/RPP1/RPP2